MQQSTKPAPGSDDEFRQQTLTAAWNSARAVVEAVSQTIMESCATPAFQALPNAPHREAQFAHRQFMQAAIEALYVAEMAFQTGIASGCIDPARVAHAKQYAQGFVLAACTGQRCFCTGATEAGPCTWKGTLEDAGPAMLCPTCGQRTLDMLNLAVPTGDLPGAPPGPRLVR